MTNALTVLVAGTTKPCVDELNIMLTKVPGIQVKTKLMTGNQNDPLQSMTELPEVLMLDLSERGEEMLKALLNRPVDSRPIILAVGTEMENPNLMRLAMQVGARDFFRRPVSEKEVISTLRQIMRELLARSRGEQSRLTAVMNAKGGTGASFLACNLAHIMASQLDKRTLLADMDLQFGTQALNLSIEPEQGIFELLQEIDHLDLVALDVFLAKHKSGLRLLSKLSDQLGLAGDISPSKLSHLIDMLLMAFDHVVVDLPRSVDTALTAFAERANFFIVCIEQTVADLKNAQHLTGLLKQDLDLSPEQLIIAVNRYHQDAQVQLDDIKRTLQIENIYCIPNDYKRVANAANLGAPLAESSAKTPVNIALHKFAANLSGIEADVQKGMLGRLFSRLSTGN